MNEETRGDRGTWRYFASWRNGQIDTAATAEGLPVSDREACQLIADERPGELFYVPEKVVSSWFIWDGRCLLRDDSNLIGRLAEANLESLDRVKRHAPVDLGAVATDQRLRYLGDALLVSQHAPSGPHRLPGLSNGLSVPRTPRPGCR